jgi:UDP-glucuronate 4-epimerase
MTITGNKGFIGSRLSELTGWGGFDIESDIRDSVRLIGDTVHLAGLAGVAKSIEYPYEYRRTNVDGTLNVIRACSEGSHFIFASSSSIYECKSPYAETKAICEANIINSGHIKPCILRFHTVYGPNGRRDMAPFLFMDAIAKGDLITLYGNNLRDFTYVDDVCKAIIRCYEQGITGVHDVGFGQPVPTSELLFEIERAMGKKANVKRAEPRSFDAKHTSADPSLMIDLGITQTPLREGIEKMVKWYADNITL